MSEQFNIFISWSGDGSKWVASALHDWLPLVIQAARPWMSAPDIEKGSRGLNEISARLLGMRVGIVCLTPQNLDAPWILYEAGALSKTIDDRTRLCTYLLDGLRFQEVKPPLGMFQATSATKEDTRALVLSINKAVGDSPVPDQNLEVIFERMWPDLEDKLARMPRSEQPAPKRQLDDMVTEMLEIARAEGNSRKSMELQISRIQDTLNRGIFSQSRWNPFVQGEPTPSTPRFATLGSLTGVPPEIVERLMSWFYQIRDANGRLVKKESGFLTQDSALAAGEKERDELIRGGTLEEATVSVTTGMMPHKAAG
jgi:hypothetical protein